MTDDQWATSVDAALNECGYRTIELKGSIVAVGMDTDPRTMHRAAVLVDGDVVGDLTDWMRWQIDQCEARGDHTDADVFRRWFRHHGLLTDTFTPEETR